jgi:Protein of unknown function (DUF1592)/Protein of unknown function (DUF1588)/Protein of unknown function (DUF1585)/Protein of unknown function (DUF1595)/Protein of unknown function (DUF1587)
MFLAPQPNFTARFRNISRSQAWFCSLLVVAATAGCQADIGDSGDGLGTTGGTGGTGVGVGGSQSGAGGGSVSVGGGAPAGGWSGLGTGGVAVEELPPFAPYKGMLRRLTRSQFKNAVFDLLGAEVNVASLEADSFDGEFSTVGAGTTTTSSRGAENYQTAIEGAVESVFSDAARRATLLGCAPTSADDPCISAFISKFGERAWRRPLDTLEVEQLKGVVGLVMTELGELSEALKWATVAILGSPNFIYRPELGVSQGAGLSLEPYEVASRLAFLIWNSLPDEELLEDARSGRLSTPAQIREVASRMLETTAGREAVGAFAEDYMRLDRIASQAKDAGLFPEYGPALQAGMVQDMRETWVINTFDENASVLNVFSTPTVYANAAVAKAYGLDAAGLDDETFKVFSLPENGPRLGILSKMGFLSQFANQKEGSPTLRGKFIREAILCTPVEPPPGNVALEVPESTPDKPMTKRDRLAAHREAPVCADCHALMDPLGLPLESFDAIGRYRTLDSGLPIDASGDFDGIPVDGAAPLGQVMSQSDSVASCLVHKYYTYATGHKVRDVDEKLIFDLATSFKSSGYRFQSLILDLVSSQAFTAVAPQE